MARAWRVEWHTQLASTNDRAKELARGGAPGGTVVVADRQTSGRGRGDHAWASPAGGLYASVLLRDLPRPVVPLLALLATQALVDALERRVPEARFWVKWPNDVLAAAATDLAPVGKVAGVLLEGSGSGDGLEWVVLGFGVNAATDPAALPPGLEPPAVSLRTLSRTPVTPPLLLDGLLDALDVALDRYGNDPALLVKDAEPRLAFRGDDVRLATRDGATVTGRLVGLAPDGAVRLAVAGVERRVPAWEAEALRRLV